MINRRGSVVRSELDVYRVAQQLIRKRSANVDESGAVGFWYARHIRRQVHPFRAVDVSLGTL